LPYRVARRRCSFTRPTRAREFFAGVPDKLRNVREALMRGLLAACELGDLALNEEPSELQIEPACGRRFSVVIHVGKRALGHRVQTIQTDGCCSTYDYRSVILSCKSFRIVFDQNVYCIRFVFDQFRRRRGCERPAQAPTFDPGNRRAAGSGLASGAAEEVLAPAQPILDGEAGPTWTAGGREWRFNRPAAAVA
jgi:hypothetical protein